MHTGQILHSGTGPVFPRIHPRMCGADENGCGKTSTVVGSSPCIRGRSVGKAFIPEHDGSSPCTRGDFLRIVNYPPLMRGIPRLEVEASAPRSFSFPAYEESSLQDDCNHPNLTISTGDPRRPVRFIHNEGLSFLCVRMSGCACHPFRLIQDISCCLLIPVHGMSAYRTEIRPVGQF